MTDEHSSTTNAERGYSLWQLGWRPSLDEFLAPYAQHYQAGRVAVEQRGQYTLYTEHGEIQAAVAGKLIHHAGGREDYPAVGDWVIVPRSQGEKMTVIHGILPRTSRFTRKAAGDTSEEQIVAANIDRVFLCMGLDGDFNLRRLERYLVVAWESGALPVVVLTKADLCPDPEARIRHAASVAAGAELLAVSSYDGRGIDRLREYFTAGVTGVLLGSSGVGKSSLVNVLLGWERQTVQEVRVSDSRGRHTTTYRELIVLPGGGLLIDTPGMRELGILEAQDGLATAFTEVEAWARNCRFRNCRHGREPGCAVRAAIEEGVLAPERLESYARLQREEAFAARKAAARAAMLGKVNRRGKPRVKRVEADGDG